MKKRKYSSVKGFEKLEDRLACAGLTILTHGFQLEDKPNMPAWVNGMSDAIAQRTAEEYEIDYHDIAQFRMQVTKINTQLAVSDFTFNNNFNANVLPTEFDLKNSANAEAIIALDWSALAGFPQTSTTQVAQTVSNYLLQDTTLNKQLLSLPMHLIGHSRGASLINALAEKFGEKDLFVDHLTLLDPVPVSGDWGFLDVPLQVPDNVIFTDNYYRKWEFLSRIVNGTYQINLQEIVNQGGYGATIPGQHSNVHLWYHGTITEKTPFSDGEIHDFDPNPVNWYTEYDRNNHGYALTFVNKQSLFQEGVAENIFGLYGLAERKKISQKQDEFDEIVIIETARKTIRTNIKIPLQLFYTDKNNDAIITVGFDIDTNPYNGVVTQEIVTNKMSDQNALQIVEVDTQNLVGKYYMYAKIENEKRIQYDYSSTKIIRADAEELPFDIIGLSLKVLDAVIEPGKELTLKYDISNIGTATIVNHPFTIAWYISRNDFMSTDDRFLEQEKFDYIPGGRTLGFLEKKVILPDVCDPFWKEQGGYSLALMIDPDDDFKEEKETNNVYQVQIDLSQNAIDAGCSNKSALIMFPKEDVLTSEAATPAYTYIKLNTRPSSDVLVNIVSENPQEGIVFPHQLFFTPQDWNTSQRITVTGVDDSIKDGDKNYLIRLSTHSFDANYRGLQDAIEAVTLDIGAYPYRNPFHHQDVNADSSISPIDVLLIFNALNNKSQTRSFPPFLDVSGDGYLAPLDALIVINYLNNQTAQPEAESLGYSAHKIKADLPSLQNKDIIFQDDSFMFYNSPKKTKIKRKK
ncbi:MAG: dockerin type I domain-containing protein [Nanoarchaeota archaeon]|mgnify:CR=1 FL=1